MKTYEYLMKTKLENRCSTNDHLIPWGFMEPTNEKESVALQHKNRLHNYYKDIQIAYSPRACPPIMTSFATCTTLNWLRFMK